MALNSGGFQWDVSRGLALGIAGAGQSLGNALELYGQQKKAKEEQMKVEAKNGDYYRGLLGNAFPDRKLAAKNMSGEEAKAAYDGLIAKQAIDQYTQQQQAQAEDVRDGEIFTQLMQQSYGAANGAGGNVPDPNAPESIRAPYGQLPKVEPMQLLQQFVAAGGSRNGAMKLAPYLQKLGGYGANDKGTPEFMDDPKTGTRYGYNRQTGQMLIDPNSRAQATVDAAKGKVKAEARPVFNRRGEPTGEYETIITGDDPEAVNQWVRKINEQTKDGGDAAVDVSKIPDGAVAKLKADPKLAADFDKKYGAGAAKSILGK